MSFDNPVWVAERIASGAMILWITFGGIVALIRFRPRDTVQTNIGRHIKITHSRLPVKLLPCVILYAGVLLDSFAGRYLGLRWWWVAALWLLLVAAIVAVRKPRHEPTYVERAEATTEGNDHE